jgi:hypothetical protein
MKRAGWVSLAVTASACVLGSAAAAAGGGSGVPIHVKPAAGRPRTRFTVSFRAPQQTGGDPAGGPRYELTANGRSHRGCASSYSATVGPTRKGQTVMMRLAAPAPSHAWCRGHYSGRLLEILTPECPPRELCPAFIAMMDVGEFSFRVR